MQKGSLFETIDSTTVQYGMDGIFGAWCHSKIHSCGFYMVYDEIHDLSCTITCQDVGHIEYTVAHVRIPNVYTAYETLRGISSYVKRYTFAEAVETAIERVRRRRKDIHGY